MIEDCTRIFVRLNGERKRLVSNAVAAHRRMSEISGIWPAIFQVFAVVFMRVSRRKG
jgi:hypothetical protein